MRLPWCVSQSGLNQGEGCAFNLLFTFLRDGAVEELVGAGVDLKEGWTRGDVAGDEGF